MTTVRRLTLLRYSIASAYLLGILLSARLWFTAGRTFPRVPIINGLPGFVLAHDYLLSLLLFVALILSVLSKRPARYLIAVGVLTLLLVCCDQTRLQPWVYQYVIMLLVLAGRQSSPDEQATGSILAANQLVICALYFWSGVQKLNWSFGHEVVPGLIEAARVQLADPYLSYLPKASIGIALCEALIGIGLLFRKTRPVAVLVALATHLVVLVLLIVAARNSIVWPWNAAMILLVPMLFWRVDNPLTKTLLSWRQSNLPHHFVKVVIVICGLAPALSFAGYWDMYLSAALYSGNTPVAVVRIGAGERDRLPLTAQRQVFATSHGDLMLPFYEWSMAELNVPPYPETRVYRQLARQLCSSEASHEQLELIVKERPALFAGSYSVTRASCAELTRR